MSLLVTVSNIKYMNHGVHFITKMSIIKFKPLVILFIVFTCVANACKCMCMHGLANNSSPC